MRYAGLAFCTALTLATVAVLLGCDNHPTRQTQSAAVVRLAPQRQDGGDPNAWLSSNGDLGDSSYCNAHLRLPLDPEPVWEYTYSAAEVSPNTVQSLVHFDGILAGSAGSSVIFLLDASSGHEIVKQNAYAPVESDVIQQERFFSLMFGPNGALAAVDRQGRYNVWAWPRGGLTRVGLSAVETTGNLGFVLTGKHLVGMNGDLLAAMPLQDPDRPAWGAQLVHPAWGVVAARDGTIVAWTPFGTLAALDPEGNELWRSQEAHLINRVVLDPSRPEAYVAASDGMIAAVQLYSGSEKWRYDYRQLLPPQRQIALGQQLRTALGESDGQQGVGEIDLLAVVISITPQGLFLAFQSGDCVMLDRRGREKWRANLGAMADGGLAFSNALLVHLTYEPLGISRLSRENLEFQAFRLHMPQWPELSDRPALAALNSLDVTQPSSVGAQPGDAQQASRQVVYGRLVALDPGTGRVLDSLPEGLNVAGGPMLPAKDKFVVALENEDNLYYPAPGNKPPCKVVGFNWLGPGES